MSLALSPPTMVSSATTRSSNEVRSGSNSSHPAKRLQKRTDVLSLLDGVGASEEVRAYYVDALAGPTAADNAGSDSEDE